MKIAVVGAGLAGLSVCWYLSTSFAQVALFDPKGIGGGASGVSTGLLHPFPGLRALRSWESREGMQETLELIRVSENELNRPVCEKTGIFRPALTPSQKRDYLARSSVDEEAIWQEESEFGCGLWIPGGITLYSRLYLEGLWLACKSKGVSLIERSIASLQELASFDAIVLTVGFDSLSFAPHLPLQVTKGQTLLCRWEKRLPYSLVSQGHITPTEHPDICQIGSTYEHGFTNLDPEPKVACELLEKTAKFYPPARNFEVLEIRSSARISRPFGYRPIMEKLNPKTWIFTGLGSRGMLYHGWLGKQLAQEILIFS